MKDQPPNPSDIPNPESTLNRFRPATDADEGSGGSPSLPFAEEDESVSLRGAADVSDGLFVPVHGDACQSCAAGGVSEENTSKSPQEAIRRVREEVERYFSLAAKQLPAGPIPWQNTERVFKGPLEDLLSARHNIPPQRRAYGWAKTHQDTSVNVEGEPIFVPRPQLTVYELPIRQIRSLSTLARGYVLKTMGGKVEEVQALYDEEETPSIFVLTERRTLRS